MKEGTPEPNGPGGASDDIQRVTHAINYHNDWAKRYGFSYEETIRTCENIDGYMVSSANDGLPLDPVEYEWNRNDGRSEKKTLFYKITPLVGPILAIGQAEFTDDIADDGSYGLKKITARNTPRFWARDKVVEADYNLIVTAQDKYGTPIDPRALRVNGVQPDSKGNTKMHWDESSFQKSSKAFKIIGDSRGDEFEYYLDLNISHSGDLIYFAISVGWADPKFPTTDPDHDWGNTDPSPGAGTSPSPSPSPSP